MSKVYIVRNEDKQFFDGKEFNDVEFLKAFRFEGVQDTLDVIEQLPIGEYFMVYELKETPTLIVEGCKE